MIAKTLRSYSVFRIVDYLCNTLLGIIFFVFNDLVVVSQHSTTLQAGCISVIKRNETCAFPILQML